MGADTDIIRLEFPATTHYLSLLGVCLSDVITRLEAIAEPDITAYNVQLAVNEIAVNIITHAYAGNPAGRVDVTIHVANNRHQLVIELHDCGMSFDPTNVPDPDLEIGQIHGYGLFLVRSLMDEVNYTSRPDGNYWRLTKYL